MGDCHLYQDEIRFSLRDPEKAEVWVLVRGEGDCPHQIVGWRYKAFPVEETVFEILQKLAEGHEHPIEWERRDPPPTPLNYTPDWEALEAEIKARMIN